MKNYIKIVLVTLLIVTICPLFVACGSAEQKETQLYNYGKEIEHWGITTQRNQNTILADNTKTNFIVILTFYNLFDTNRTLRITDFEIKVDNKFIDILELNGSQNDIICYGNDSVYIKLKTEEVTIDNTKYTLYFKNNLVGQFSYNLGWITAGNTIYQPTL